MSEGVSAVIKERTSIRSYLPERVEDETIQEILEAGHEAPSAGNLQPWEFYVVKNSDKINDLAQAAYDQHWMSEAPVVIVVCGLFHVSADEYGERGAELYTVQDTAAAVENMLLAAEDNGLGSCWVGAFEEEKIMSVLNIDESAWPVAMITIGYPQEETSASPKRSLDEVVTYIQ